MLGPQFLFYEHLALVLFVDEFKQGDERVTINAVAFTICYCVSPALPV